MPDGHPLAGVDDPDLLDVLSRALAAATGSARVVAAQGRHSEWASSYEAEVVSLTLEGGERIRLFLKDFGVCCYEKDGMDRRRVREWRVYRDLLADAGLGTPRYYGLARDEARARFWLLLEFVEAVQVKHCDLEAWVAACEWLGSMHTHFASRVATVDGDFLVRHDEAFLAVPAERALAAAALLSPVLGRRVRAVADAYAEMLPLMLREPMTLVHGGFRPQNVMVAAPNGTARTVAVDWEEAGVGSRFSDVAYFLDGFDDARRARLLDAYRRGAGGPDVLGADEHADVLVDCYGLWKNLATLGKAVDRQFPLPAVEKLVGIVERLASRATDNRRSPAPPRRRRARSVDRLVALRLGRPVGPATVRRTPSPFATLSKADVVSLTMADGDELSVFTKVPAASAHPDKRRADREIAVYDRLLDDDALPVPAYLGVAGRDGGAAGELVLEHVNDWDLRYQDLEHWATAAAELARLHAWFAARPDELRACAALLRLDARYFRTWARRAFAAVAERTPALAAGLRAVVDDLDAAGALLDRQPPTLVHNDLSPKNVIADRSRAPARICFVDWEMAGVGCGMLDIVHLRYGVEPASARELEEAYVAGLRGSSLVPGDEAERRRLVAACELHGAIYRLAHASDWRSPADRVAGWLKEARAFHAAVAR